MGARGPKPRPDEGRFKEKISPLPSGCIVWTAGTNGVGYGLFHPNAPGSKGKVYAHRWAWEQLHGPIPEGLHIDHLCRNTLCVNPDHLEPVSIAVNVLRGFSSPARNARKSHCKRGHPLTGANLYTNPTNGYRHCRECARAQDRARKRNRSRKAV